MRSPKASATKWLLSFFIAALLLSIPGLPASFVSAKLIKSYSWDLVAGGVNILSDGTAGIAMHPEDPGCMQLPAEPDISRSFPLWLATTSALAGEQSEGQALKSGDSPAKGNKEKKESTNAWIPFFQSLVWPIFLILLIVCFWRKFNVIFDAIKERIAQGAGFKIPGVFELLVDKIDKTKKIADDTKQVAEETKRDTNKRIWLNFGELYSSQGKWDDAKYSFNEALKEDSKWPNAIVAFAKTLREQSQNVSSDQQRITLLNEAEEKCNDAINLSKWGTAYYVRATVKKLKNDPMTSVEEDLKAAVDLMPDLKEFIKEDKYFKGVERETWFTKLIS
jgi:tetratricopeptide (TPR) repeat protein